MKSLNMLRQLNLASFIMLACAIYCAVASFHYVTVNGNKFFFAVGGVTSVMLGFAVVLNVLNIFMMPRDKFYSNGAWTFHLLSVLLLVTSFTAPEEYLINFISIAVLSIFNIVVFLSTMSFRSRESTLINQLRKLFPDEKFFNFDIDFKFKKDFIEDAVDTYISGIRLLTPFGKVVFVGDGFYFDDRFHEAKRFVTSLKDCGFKFNKATPDEMKVVEMHVY
jgi:hypothetical protein